MHKLPAVPPDDYQGSMWEWEEALMVHGHLKPEEGYMDAIDKTMSEEEYIKVLEYAESANKA